MSRVGLVQPTLTKQDEPSARATTQRPAPLYPRLTARVFATSLLSRSLTLDFKTCSVNEGYVMLSAAASNFTPKRRCARSSIAELRVVPMKAFANPGARMGLVFPFIGAVLTLVGVAAAPKPALQISLETRIVGLEPKVVSEDRHRL